MLSYTNRRLRQLYYVLPPLARDLAASAYSIQRRPIRYGRAFQKQLNEFEQGTATRDRERLLALLRWAGREVPYYRSLFASLDFDPVQDDFTRIPPIDKAQFRADPHVFRAESFRGPTVVMQTSGTTGSPLRIELSSDAYQRSYAVVWFHYGWAGIHRGERIATFAGHPVTPPERLRGPFWVHDWTERELLFSSQHLTPQTLPEYASALARFRPSLVRGYPSSVYFLAQQLLQMGRTDIRPKAVFTSSETLLEHQRETIEAAFQCKVYSYYGNGERVAHMLQCAAGNFHVASEVCLLEILGPDGQPAPAEVEGELVCTSLINFAMPLLRYRIGDRGTRLEGPCPCGRNGPLMRDIGGRVDDVVVTPDGRHLGRLDPAFRGVGHLIEAQVIQDRISDVEVRIVVQPGWSAADERQLLENLRQRMGPAIGIHIRPVPAIERTTTGKFRFVISQVAESTVTAPRT